MQFSKKALFLQPSLCISENKYVRCAVHLVFNTFGYGPFTDFMGLTLFTGFRGLTWSSISLHITENRFDISKIRGSLHYSWYGLRYILNFVLQLPYINAPWKLCKTSVKQGVFRGLWYAKSCRVSEASLCHLLEQIWQKSGSHCSWRVRFWARLNWLCWLRLWSCWSVTGCFKYFGILPFLGALMREKSVICSNEKWHKKACKLHKNGNFLSLLPPDKYLKHIFMHTDKSTQAHSH